MNDNLFSLVLVPADTKRFFIRVRLWSAKGKAIEKLKATIAQLDGYVYQKDATLEDLYEWCKQHVEEAQAQRKSKYGLAMDQQTTIDYYGCKCQTLRIYITKMDGDMYDDVVTVYAIPIKGTICLGSFPSKILANPPFDTTDGKGGER